MWLTFMTLNHQVENDRYCTQRLTGIKNEEASDLQSSPMTSFTCYVIARSGTQIDNFNFNIPFEPIILCMQF